MRDPARLRSVQMARYFTNTTLLLACYAWAASRRPGAGKWLRKFTTRVAALAAAAFVLYSPLVIAYAEATPVEPVR